MAGRMEPSLALKSFTLSYTALNRSHFNVKNNAPRFSQF